MQESESRTTRENAQYTRALLEGQRINHILLVTSGSHGAARYCGVCRTGVHRDRGLHRPSNTASGWAGPRVVTYRGPSVPVEPRHSRMGRLSGLLMAWISRALRDRKPGLDARHRRLDIELFEVAVVVTCPAPEGTIKAVYLSVTQLPRHAFAGQPSFFEHHCASLSAHMVENALVVGAIGSQPSAQCSGANV